MFGNPKTKHEMILLHPVHFTIYNLPRMVATEKNVSGEENTEKHRPLISLTPSLSVPPLSEDK